LTYFPLFSALTHTVNPALEKYQESVKISVAASDCNFHIFVLPGTKFTKCDKVKDFLTKSGLNFETLPAVEGKTVVTTIGDIVLEEVDNDGKIDEAKYKEALAATSYPTKADKEQIAWIPSIAILTLMVLYVTMVYGPIAAYLVELFPTNIRYTSMSLPYHIGNGWFGGMLPLIATAMVASSGNIYHGLWYPIIVAVMTVVIGGLFLKDTVAGGLFHKDSHDHD